MCALRLDEAPVLFTKREVARIQLVEAICLFVAGKYIPCITLAGAAEEIFARLLNNVGQSSIAELSIDEIEKIREKTGLNVMGGRPKNEIYNLWNSARNSLKHHNKSASEEVELHLFNDAYMMIRRALFNAKSLGVTIQNSQDFENRLIADALKSE
jgi:hypothetical protein